ncbi:acyl-CoA desaturase [Candidatus Gracilibacteria bacterium]|nr:acyl-CoA desaturase [Candidatus Gracilibacteria bacterium]
MHNLQSLDKSVFTQGFMKRQYSYYIILAIINMSGLILSVGIFFITDSILILILGLAFLTFFRVQIGFLGHDLAHDQVFKNRKYNRFFGYLSGTLIMGVSHGFWRSTHNAHHDHTNQGDNDPDFPFLRDAEFFKSFPGGVFILRNIHLLFFPSFMLGYYMYIVQSLQFIFTKITAVKIYELFLLIVNFIAYASLFIVTMGVTQGIIFLLLHFVFIGIYMGISFAPNHLGMEEIQEDETYERYFQIITSRNLYPGFLVNYIFGGLNYQIEHHLYQTMPRKNYPEVAKIVKQYCTENNIPYRETTFLGSYKEIYASLKEFSKS